MATRFKQGTGDWKEYRKLEPKPVEVDFHIDSSYYSTLDRVQRFLARASMLNGAYDRALEAIKQAQLDGAGYVLFLHGWSTSIDSWRKTCRSEVLRLMRSKAATPYILRSECIEHDSVFVAAIRPAKQVAGPESPKIDAEKEARRVKYGQPAKVNVGASKVVQEVCAEVLRERLAKAPTGGKKRMER